MAEEPAEEVGRRAAPLTPVTWTDVVGASASGNDLTKTAPETAFNAGAVSVESMAGDGFVEFTTGEATTDKAVGLSSGNGGQALADIDFAIRLNASGRASVWEGGVNRGGIGPYAAGDTFRVQAESGLVTYYRNGVLRYTSALAPSFPLLVDTSLRTPGATIQDVAIEPIDFWTSAVNVSVDGNDISKTAPETSFNAGAVSLATIASGAGYVEFRAGETTTLKAAGLGSGNGGTSRGDIEFAISLNPDGVVTVYESGVLRGNFGLYTPDDVFRVQVESGVVSYLKNRVVFRTTVAPLTYPLLLDTAISTPGGSIVDAKLVAGYLTDECALLDDVLPGPVAPFGSVMDAAGDVVLVGHPEVVPPVAQVWRRGEPEATTIDRPVTPTGDSFAYLVATDGETLAIGMGGGSGNRGYVAVYRFDGADWLLEDVLDGCSDDRFGLQSIAVQGDLVVAEGASTDRAYVFRRAGDGSWSLDGVLSGEGFDEFGTTVAVGGDRVFVAAISRQPAGAVDVFRHNPALPDPPELPSCDNLSPGKWRRRAELLATPPHSYGGSDIDTDPTGTRLVIGDYRNDVHVFDVAGGVWNETAVLDEYPNDILRTAVALGGPGPGADSVVVAQGDDGNYVFAELQEGWTQIQYLPVDGDCAIAGNLVFNLRDDGDVAVYPLEPLCLAE